MQPDDTAQRYIRRILLSGIDTSKCENRLPSLTRATNNSTIEFVYNSA